MTTRIIGLLVCAAVALTVPTRAEAQGIKGLIKKKVTESKSEEKRPSDPKTAMLARDAKIGRGEYEVTKELIDDFIIGLETEIRLRKEFKKQLLTYKTPDEYQACSQQVAMSPEMQEMVMALGTLPENASAEDFQRAQKKMYDDMQALQKKKCGLNIKEDWPSDKRTVRLREIEQAGADAFNAAHAARGTRSSGPAVADYGFDYEMPGSNIYAQLKDKLISFCQAMKQNLIILDTDGLYKFNFSTKDKLDDLWSQDEAANQARVCPNKQYMFIMTGGTAGQDEDLEDLEIQR